MIGKIKGSLVSKVTLVFLVASIVPYLLASLFFFQSSRNSLYQEIVRGLEKETSLIRDNLDAKLSLLQGNAVAWADLAVMHDILNDDLDKRIATTLDGLKRDYNLSGDIHAINSAGKIVASSSPAHIGKRVHDVWLAKTLRGETVALDIHASSIDGDQSVSFAAPVIPLFSDTGPIGALLLEYHAERLIETAPADAMPEIALINHKNEVIAAFPQKGPFKPGGIYLPQQEAKTLKSPAGYIVAFAGSREYPRFKGFGWTVAVAVSEKRALDPIKDIERVSFGIAFLGALLIPGLVTLFARRTVKPLKELSSAANRIAETKDFSSTVVYDSADEVGQLAKAFNGMVKEVNRHMQKMQEMEENMRRADRLSALGELSAGMAHEIKNPLGVIRSSADILKGRLDAGKQEGLLASAISEESMRLSRLLEAFLQFARPAPPEFNLCNMNEVVEKSLVLLDSEISQHGVTLVKELDPALPALYSDADQLHQVLVNIIINAIQAMPEGGKIRVSTRLRPPETGQEPAASQMDDATSKIELAISDTGTGIAPEDKGNIFNPFFTTRKKGTGLGLSIVFRIITALGGEVKLEAGFPKGTVFRIILPARLEA